MNKQYRKAYNHENRRSLLTNNVMISSIDRIKLSYAINNRTIERLSTISKDYRKHDLVKKGKTTEIGIYVILRNKKTNESLFLFKGSLQASSSRYIIDDKISKVAFAFNKFEEESYKLKGFTKEFIGAINHNIYYIYFKDEDILVQKKKNFLTFEFNDSLQQINIPKPYERLVNVIMKLFEADLLIPITVENDVNKLIDHILSNLTLSEVEIASDFNYEISEKIKNYIWNKNYNDQRIVKHKNTLYYNSPKKKFTFDIKFYDRGLKDFLDKYGYDPTELTNRSSSNSLSEDIDKNLVELENILRFEMTVKITRLKKLLEQYSLKELLSFEHHTLLSLLHQPCHSALLAFYKMLSNDLIEYIVNRIPNSIDDRKLSKYRMGKCRKVKMLFEHSIFQTQSFDLLM